MARGRYGLVVVALIALVASAIGAALVSEAGATREDVEADPCLSVPRAMVGALSSGLKPKARGKLGKTKAVRSRAQISGPRGFAAGAYFVSAPVRGFGVATWAADARAFRTGGGFITGVGPVARRVSYLGVDLPPSALQAWGISERTHGYVASRRCAQ